ncbi:peptide deformylase [Desulfococcus multivorans]|uniref:Peptide deformylase n=1 Tax=Desulfococcus multivorans DSM 2059 TaxID=1121405 RepID=S7TQ69_DESML|nr:peptide deformylase [Desulfococcus multivorans]AOY58977.1 Def: peptide deformylase [Desulfococcus multivorans]AQV01244.1 peptide deformylase [Desulfococcus multivorans]EPR39116.1 Peptide deformylase [Desulfococcus multivorans DSM 2059]SJZ54597.1 peptide deformylase [Desulfococcus multivorans DSM 2059]
MEPLEIVTYPDKFLKQPTKPVENIDGELQNLIDRMAHTMFAAPGVGLAAIQVGHDKSLIVYDGNPGEDRPSLQVLINPRIVEAQGTIISENEGCLSVPDFRADVKRNAAVVVEGVDRDGKPVRIERNDFLAVVLQHEIDHLNGVLFIDRISALKRQLYRKRILKQIRHNE